MSKESPYSSYPNLIFRETFNDESTVRKNGGTPTDVDFSEGKGTFNGSSSKVNYNLGLNGTYSVRVRCKPTSFANFRYLIDARGTNSDGTGLIYLNQTTGAIASTSGTAYVNGEPTSATTAGENNEIIMSGITLRQGTGVNLTLIGSQFSNIYEFLGDMDLVEIYKGTLTASEVANLYTNSAFKELTGYNFSFDASMGILDTLGTEVTTADMDLVKRGSKYFSKFNGSSSVITVGNIGNIKSINFVINYQGNNMNAIMDLDGTNKVSISSGTLSYWGDNAYINGVDTDTLNMGLNFITILDTSGINASAFRMGYDGSSYLDGELNRVQTFERELSLNEHTQFWTEALMELK